MSVIGALIGGAIGAYGKKPIVPDLSRIDPSSVQRQTVAGNANTLPEASALASAINAQRRGEGRAALEATTPGATDILATGASSIAAMLKGQLPADVKQQVEQSAASRSFAGGFGGTGAASGLTARDLGRTSLDLIARGQDSAQRWLSSSLQLLQPGGFFDVSSMMFTPEQRLSFEVVDRSSRFSRDLLAAQVKAAPDPATAALGREIDRFFNTMEKYGMSKLGEKTPETGNNPTNGANGGKGGGRGGSTGGRGIQGYNNQNYGSGGNDGQGDFGSGDYSSSNSYGSGAESDMSNSGYSANYGGYGGAGYGQPDYGGYSNYSGSTDSSYSNFSGTGSDYSNSFTDYYSSP